MRLSNQSFTIRDLKQLLWEAYESDYSMHKGKVKFFPLMANEWTRSPIFKKILSLYPGSGYKLSEMPLRLAGVYFSEEQSFCVFLKSNQITRYSESLFQTSIKKTVDYLISVFHELAHHYDEVWRHDISINNELPYNIFIYDINNFVSIHDLKHYESHHDDYYDEILEELYGVKRTRKFLQSKGMLTEEIELMLTEYENNILFAENNYDIHIFLQKFHEIVMNDSGESVQNNPYAKLFYEFDTFYGHQLYSHYVGFRSIDEILMIAKARSINSRILNDFFSSKDFLDSLDFNNLSSKNKQVIMNAIEYALEIESNRRKKNKEFYQNRQIEIKQYLDADARICSKIAYFNIKLEELKTIISLSNVNENLEDFKR